MVNFADGFPSQVQTETIKSFNDSVAYTQSYLEPFLSCPNQRRIVSTDSRGYVVQSHHIAYC